MGEIREGARVSNTDGTSGIWKFSPDIPLQPGQGQMLTDVLRLALNGDIASIEPVQYEVLDQ